MGINHWSEAQSLNKGEIKERKKLVRRRREWKKVDLGVQIVWHSSCRWRNYNMMMASFYSFYYCPGQHYWFPGIKGHVKTKCLNTIFPYWSYYENGSSNLTKHFVHLCNCTFSLWFILEFCYWHTFSYLVAKEIFKHNVKYEF